MPRLRRYTDRGGTGGPLILHKVQCLVYRLVSCAITVAEPSGVLSPNTRKSQVHEGRGEAGQEQRGGFYRLSIPIGPLDLGLCIARRMVKELHGCEVSQNRAEENLLFSY